MFSTAESHHRAYIVAVLLCSVFPASLVFWGVGFIVGIALAYLFVAGYDYAVNVNPLAIQIVALLASLSVVYRFWEMTIGPFPDKSADVFQALFRKPRTVKGLLCLLVAGSLSTLSGLASFVVGWITIGQF